MTTPTAHETVRTDVLVVGAGPGGASAATHLARLGRDVILADGATFPRDKACGDGLTPRAVAELEHLKLDHVLQGGPVNKGLRGYGFGKALVLPWNGPHLPKHGSAIARTVLDNALRAAALDAGATGLDGHRAVDVVLDRGKLTGVVLRSADRIVTVEAKQVIVADGGKSHLGRQLGRTWHQETVFGVASRAYATSPNADDPWITSHLELRDETGRLAAEHLIERGPLADLTTSWADELYAEYGEAFSIARRLGILITSERIMKMSGPIGMRTPGVMKVAFRVMGNLVTPEDRDVVARAWRLVGRASLALDSRRPFH